MGFRTTGVRLVANVTQYVRELNRSADATRDLGDKLDSARVKAARMANDLAGVKGRVAGDLDMMRDHVKKLDDQILTTRKTIMGMSQSFAKTGDTGIFKQLQAEQAKLKNLVNVRNLLPDPAVAQKAGGDLAKNVAKGFDGPWQAAMLVRVAPAILAFTPVMSGLIAGAVVGAAGLGGVLGGLVLAARDPRVQTAGANLGKFVLGDLEKRADRFVEPTLNSIERIRLGWRSLAPDLDRVFTASRFVEPLTDAAIRGGKAFMTGFADAVAASEPVVAAIGNMVDQAGHSLGDFMSLMAENADVGAAALNDLSVVLADVVSVAAELIEAGAEVYRFGAEVKQAGLEVGYWIEDHNKWFALIGDQAGQLDLTADGFKAGSAAADAYRKATMGTATTADFATLKTAEMTDAQIAAIDASGTYRAQLDQVTAANQQVGLTEDQKKQATEAATAAQKNLTLATKMYKESLDELGPAGGRARSLMEGLQTAQKNLYGAAMAGTDANITYEDSWDKLTISVGKDGAALDIHKEQGRKNTKILRDMLLASNDMYFANIGMGQSTDQARIKHEARRKAIEKEAAKLGLDKKATQELINTYGKIPKDKTTKIIQTGLASIAKALQDLYVLQRLLAKGVPATAANIAAEQGAIANAGFKATGTVKDFKAAGGPIHGPGTKTSDSVPVMASRGEYMQRAAAVDYYGVQAMNAINQKRIPRDALNYATGGMIAPVHRGSYLVKVNVSKTRVPSKAEAMSKVAPAFGDWPSSPAAQRGDSGVWRKIVALIKSTGPMSGSFGNAYRPGDPKWHGSGRAVDWMGFNQDRLATFLANKRPLELIHRTNQRDYAYTRGKNKGSFNNSLMEAHRNHVHIAMHNGGVIREPVVGIGASGASYSFGERGPEVVMPAGGAGRNANTVVNVSVQAGYVVTERALEDKIAATVDNLVRKGRI